LIANAHGHKTLLGEPRDAQKHDYQIDGHILSHSIICSVADNNASDSFRSLLSDRLDTEPIDRLLIRSNRWLRYSKNIFRWPIATSKNDGL
jgi:hypothetical protein